MPQDVARALLTLERLATSGVADALLHVRKLAEPAGENAAARATVIAVCARIEASASRAAEEEEALLCEFAAEIAVGDEELAAELIGAAVLSHHRRHLRACLVLCVPGCVHAGCPSAIT